MKPITNKVAVGVAVLALVVSVTLIVFMYLLSNQLHDMRRDSFIGNAQLGYSISKLEFCVNHRITLCEDAALTTWNDAHSDDRFSLKTYQQVVEDGIAEYEASRK